MTFQAPSFKSSDMSDEFYFVGRLKENDIRVEEKTNSKTQEKFDQVTLHPVWERLDSETITTRHSWFRVPSGKISPGSPLGKYIIANETAGTPFEFNGGTLDDLQEVVDEHLGSVYVMVQKSIVDSRRTEPGRYCFPVAKIGEGNEWSTDEAARIISDARSVSASSASSGKTPAQVNATAEKPSMASLRASVIGAGAGLPVESATQAAIAYVNQNMAKIPQPAVFLTELGKGEAFWMSAQNDGLCTIDNGVVSIG